ncbi:MAG: hypothetical protein ACFB4J_01345 [Elainellaceae cyanobacterium]
MRPIWATLIASLMRDIVCHSRTPSVEVNHRWRFSTNDFITAIAAIPAGLVPLRRYPASDRTLGEEILGQLDGGPSTTPLSLLQHNVRG